MEIPKIIPATLAWLVAAGIPILLIVCYRLWKLLRLNRLRSNVVLRERLLISIRDAIIITIFSLVFLNNGMEEPPLGVPETQVLTRTTMLLPVIFAIYWLYMYRKHDS